MDYTPPTFNLRLALLRTQNQDQNKLMKLFYDNTVWKLSKYGLLPGPCSVQILGHFSRSVNNTHLRTLNNICNKRKEELNESLLDNQLASVHILYD